MRKLVLIIGLFVHLGVFVGSIRSQGLQTEIKVHRPTLSGKWKLNNLKSKFPNHWMLMDRKLSHIMVVEQNEESLSITFKVQEGTSNDESFFGGKMILFPDGRGDKTVHEFDRYLSVTNWQGDKLVRSQYLKKNGVRDELIEIQELTLSFDGKSIVYIVKGTDQRPVIKKDGTYGAERFFDDESVGYYVWDRIS